MGSGLETGETGVIVHMRQQCLHAIRILWAIRILPSHMVKNVAIVST